VQGLRFGVYGLGLWVQGLRLRVECFGFRVYALWVSGFGFRVQGLGFRV